MAADEISSAGAWALPYPPSITLFVSPALGTAASPAVVVPSAKTPPSDVLVAEIRLALAGSIAAMPPRTFNSHKLRRYFYFSVLVF